MPPESAGDSLETLSGVIAAYLEAADAGETPCLEDWVARYPQFATELQDYFAGDFALHAIAKPIRPDAHTPPLPPLRRGGKGAPLPPLRRGGKGGCAPRPRQPGSSDHTRVTRSKAPARHAPTPVPDGKARLFGDYELLEEIGRGGMGIVYRARQVSLNRTVALKMVLSGDQATPQDLIRFRQEAEIAARLEHPNLVPVHEVGERDGQYYFSMKLIAGTNLTSLLPEFGTRLKSAARMLAQVARAVHHAHQHGILHRDLKPGNILLSNEPNTPADHHAPLTTHHSPVPYVTDFGLAKLLSHDSDLTNSGAVVGTPNYMSPEQASAKKDLTSATDIYSLGAILYQILTQRKPFQAETPLATLLLVQSAEPEPPLRINPRLPRDLVTICLKCLEKEPKGRYASALALAEDLERWVAGEAIVARPARPWERAVRSVRRRPLAAALALALVALGGSTIGFWRLYSELQRKEREESPPLVLTGEDHKTRMEEYAKQLASVQKLLATKDPKEARRVLGECHAELRQWEWHYLMPQCAAKAPLDLSSVVRKNVRQAAFTTSGDELALLEPAARNQLQLKVWDRKANKVRELGSVAEIPFAIDRAGRYLAANDDKGIVVWDLARHEKKTFAGFGGYLACSPKEPLVACTCDSGKVGASEPTKKLRIWNIVSGKEAHRFDKGVFVALSFSPDGSHLAACAPGGPGLVIWDLRTEQVVFEQSGTFLTVQYAPDGQCLAATDLLGNALMLLDPASGKTRHALRTSGSGVNSLAFTPNSKRLVSRSTVDGSVQLWDTATGLEVLRLNESNHVLGSSLDCVSFDPAGNLLLIARNRSLTILDGTPKE